jgi:hypothetical protein
MNYVLDPKVLPLLQNELTLVALESCFQCGSLFYHAA